MNFQPVNMQGLMQKLIAARNSRLMSGGNGGNTMPPQGQNIPQMGNSVPVAASAGAPMQPNQVPAMQPQPQMGMGAPNPAVIQALIAARQKQAMMQNQMQGQPGVQ